MQDPLAKEFVSWREVRADDPLDLPDPVARHAEPGKRDLERQRQCHQGHRDARGCRQAPAGGPGQRGTRRSSKLTGPALRPGRTAGGLSAPRTPRGYFPEEERGGVMAQRKADPLAYRGVSCARGAGLYRHHDRAAVRDAEPVAVQSGSGQPGLCRPAELCHAVWRSALVGRLLERAWQQCLVLCRAYAGAEPDRDFAGRDPVDAAPADGGVLPHRDLHPDDPELRDRGLCLEADPVADLGHCARDAGRWG